MKKQLAEESKKTKRAREKLSKVLEEEKRKVTPESLKETVEKIHQWIADHAKERVVVKKGIRLFNQNEDAAFMSKRVEKIRIDILNRFV